MRRAAALLGCAAVIAGCGGSHKAPRPRAGARFGPDGLHYDLRLTHTRHRLRGTERIAFHNPFTRPLDHVWIHRWDNAYRHRSPHERIALAAPVAPGARGAVTVPVDVRVPHSFDRFGSLGDIDVLGNALPVLAVSDRGAEPALHPYTFFGESFFSLAADWRVALRRLPGEQVASAGTQTGRAGDVVTLAARHERDFTIVAGPMLVDQTTAAGVRVRWFSRRGTPAGERHAGLRMAADSLAALQRTLGPYGAPEFDAVQTPILTRTNGIAMEYPQLILSPVYRPGVSHEVAHQWFYRLVGDDEWSDPWVDETLAEFAAVRLGRALHGPDRLRGCAQRARPARPPAPLISDMGTLGRLQRRHPHVIRDTLYIEGPCRLFNLQRRVGSARMDGFLRGLVAHHRDGVLTGPELTAALAKLSG